MDAIVLVFVPPWVALRLAPSWPSTQVLWVVLGAVAYLVDFGIALGPDQPFDPVLVGVLVVTRRPGRFGARWAALIGSGQGWRPVRVFDLNRAKPGAWTIRR